MTTLEVDRTSEIPDHVARRVMLAEGHRDEVELYEAFEWIRANRPLARAVLDGYPPYVLSNFVGGLKNLPVRMQLR
jgi:hypothetical protein